MRSIGQPLGSFARRFWHWFFGYLTFEPPLEIRFISIKMEQAWQDHKKSKGDIEMNIKMLIAIIFLLASIGSFILALIILTANMINLIEIIAPILEILFAVFCFSVFLHYMRQSMRENR